MLPKEVFGKSSFELAVMMMRWLPLWLVDKILLILAFLILGNTDKYGVKRPEKGPLELKNTEGKTPVLDLGTIGKIRSGQVQVVPGIKRFSRGRVQLVNGEVLEIDSVILATGYKSNVPSWLKVIDKTIEIFCYSSHVVSHHILELDISKQTTKALASHDHKDSFFLIQLALFSTITMIHSIY